jgi:hypothetical protein
LNLSIAPVVYTTHVAAKGSNSIATLFPVCKVASDGTVYVAYSDGGTAIYVAHSTDQGRTWAPPLRVSDMTPGSAAMMPWIETGERPGSLALAWYGADVTESEGGVPGNTTNANWKVYYAQTLNATSSAPTILQTVASDHYIHGADISTAGFVVGGPNRNLADFFQIAIDPMGFAFIAFADDSNDFAGHSYVTHQVAGPSLHTGRAAKVKTKAPATLVDPAAPEVADWRHDARLAGNPPTYPELDTAADILSIDFSCRASASGPLIVATLRASGLDTLPPNGLWRMNFASNPTRPGLSDRADNWFVSAETSAAGAPSYSYGTAMRNTDGTLAYTKRGAADVGRFDLADRSVTVGVNVARLNALAARGAIAAGSTLLGLRGSASVSLGVSGVATSSVISDATRGGRTFALNSCEGF